jgi:threonine synthase
MTPFKSTRGGVPVPAHLALRQGAAPDGGLYWPMGDVPRPKWPFGAAPYVQEGPRTDGVGLEPAEAGRIALAPFFADGPLEHALADICAEAFDFDCPLKPLPGPNGPLSVLELFHGPTGAFKDFGARFLFRCLDRLVDQGERVTVLAATSGDTGGAVGCAAEGGRARAVILFPKDRVSPFQEHQLCCWDDPVTAIRVDADFDACQALVKQAFADPGLSRRHGLTSANSINIGRLLPQMSYWASAAFRAPGAGAIIPTGNLGNAVAALTARALGAPLGSIVLATNANRTLADWRETGEFSPRPSIATLANAMDVGAPSNFERLETLGPVVSGVVAVEDAAIKARMKEAHKLWDYLVCPHTATALEAHAQIQASSRENHPWIIAATAHPFKFAETVEAATGVRPDPSPALAAVLDRKTRAIDIPARLDALAVALDG